MAAKKKAAKATKVREVSAEEQALLELGWETVTGGAGEPWHEGMVVTGVFGGVHDSSFQQDDGEFAKLVTVETEHGVRVFRCPAVLAKRMETLHDGDDVRIECNGKVRTKAGRQAWDFSVLVKRNTPAGNAVPAKKSRAVRRGR